MAVVRPSIVSLFDSNHILSMSGTGLSQRCEKDCVTWAQPFQELHCLSLTGAHSLHMHHSLGQTATVVMLLSVLMDARQFDALRLASWGTQAAIVLGTPPCLSQGNNDVLAPWRAPVAAKKICQNLHTEC